MADSKLEIIRQEFKRLGIRPEPLKPIHLGDIVVQRHIQLLALDHKIVTLVSGSDLPLLPDSVSIRLPPGSQRPLDDDEVKAIMALPTPESLKVRIEVTPPKKGLLDFLKKQL